MNNQGTTFPRLMAFGVLCETSRRLAALGKREHPDASHVFRGIALAPWSAGVRLDRAPATRQPRADLCLLPVCGVAGRALLDITINSEQATLRQSVGKNLWDTTLATLTCAPFH